MKNNLIDRRSVLKAVLAGGAFSTLGLRGTALGQGPDGGALTLKIAGYDYDRVRAIANGALRIDGSEVSFHVESIYDASLYAFGQDNRYEITEIGLIPFIRFYINQDFRSYSLIPVFISRTFRHRNIFVRVDADIEKPEDLKGKIVGTPGYAFSANTWIRGFLLDEYGVAGDDMQWIETTASSDGGRVSPELDRHFLPQDFPLRKGPPGVDESELLLRGDCDALITAITPKAYLDGDPKIRRLFPDFRSVEQQYHRKTGVFPIMHAVAIRKDVVEANPWLPREVFEMYSKAKQVAYDDLESTTALKVSLPWVGQELEDTRSVMGDNYWPYGIEENRTELELAMRYVYEQGLTKRSMPFEELFHESTLDLTESPPY